jgi:hypothetical protein
MSLKSQTDVAVAAFPASGSQDDPRVTGGFAATSKTSQSPSSPGGTFRTATNSASTLEGERG